MRRSGTALLVLVVVLLATPSRVDALFGATSSRVGLLSAAVLQSPTNLTATANGSIGSCGVNVTWSDPQPGVPKNWRIQRYLGTSPNGTARTVTTTSYFDNTGISLLTSYSWRVSAVSGTSWASSEVSVSKLVTSLCL